MHDGGAFHSISHVEILVSIWWNCDRHNCSAQVSFDLVLDCQNVGSSPGLPHQCMEEEDMYFSGESSDEHPIPPRGRSPSIKRIFGSGDSEVCFCGTCEACWGPTDTVYDYADPTTPLWEVAYVDKMHNRLCFHDLPHDWFLTDPREFDTLEKQKPCGLNPPNHLTGLIQRGKQHGVFNIY